MQRNPLQTDIRPALRLTNGKRGIMIERLQVGVITQTHGIRGEVKVFPTTDDVNRFKKLKEVVLDNEKEQLTMTSLSQYAPVFRSLCPYRKMPHAVLRQCFCRPLSVLQRLRPDYQQVLSQLFTDDVNRFKKLKEVVLDNEKEQLTMTIAGVKFFKQYVILKFKGYDSINEIEKYKGARLFVSRDKAVKFVRRSAGRISVCNGFLCKIKQPHEFS